MGSLQEKMDRPLRVWLKAFSGFDPEDDGYLGFTRPGDRNRLLENWKSGDVVLIYGADSDMTDKQDRQQALGFLEIDPIAVVDRSRMSDRGLQRKTEMGCLDRWTHAVPVRRAWRVNRRIEIKHIAAETYTPEYARLIASRGELLLEQEAQKAFALPVTEVSVYGEPPVQHAPEASMRAAFSPSRGVPLSFGKRETDYTDGENYLYLLTFEGDVPALLGRDRYAVGNRILVKLGQSNDPAARCAAHNSHLPPACVARWKLSHTSKVFENAQAAREAEDAAKSTFAKQFESLGGEFFLGDADRIVAAFGYSAKATAFQMTGATVRRK